MPIRKRNCMTKKAELSPKLTGIMQRENRVPKLGHKAICATNHCEPIRMTTTNKNRTAPRYNRQANQLSLAGTCRRTLYIGGQRLKAPKRANTMCCSPNQIFTVALSVHDFQTCTLDLRLKTPRAPGDGGRWDYYLRSW